MLQIAEEKLWRRLWHIWCLLDVIHWKLLPICSDPHIFYFRLNSMTEVEEKSNGTKTEFKSKKDP